MIAEEADRESNNPFRPIGSGVSSEISAKNVQHASESVAQRGQYGRLTQPTSLRAGSAPTEPAYEWRAERTGSALTAQPEIAVVKSGDRSQLKSAGLDSLVDSSSLTKFTSVAAPLAAHSVTSEMSTHALQTCEPNMSTIAAASR